MAEGVLVQRVRLLDIRPLRKGEPYPEHVVTCPDCKGKGVAVRPPPNCPLPTIFDNREDPSIGTPREALTHAICMVIREDCSPPIAIGR